MNAEVADALRLKHLVETVRLFPEEIAARTRQIAAGLLAQSRHIDATNFTVFHPDDLERLFDDYDRLFFEQLCRASLGPDGLRFRISRRMTRVGGTTTRLRQRDRPEIRHYEIAVASTLLFQSFQDLERPVVVNGIL